MPRRKSRKKEDSVNEKNAAKEVANKEEKSATKQKKHIEKKEATKETKKEKAAEKKDVKQQKAVKNVEKNAINPTLAVAGIALLVLIIGIVIGMSIGGTAKSAGTAAFSKPVAYIIKSPVCDICNETMNQGIEFLKNQYGLSDKDFKIVTLSYDDPKAKSIYSVIVKSNEKAAYLPTIVLEGNIQGTDLYKKLDAFAKAHNVPLQNILQKAGNYYVLAPVFITYRYDPSKPIRYFYIYADNPEQLYRLAGQIMALQPNLVVKFKAPDSKDYVFKMEGPQDIIDSIRKYFPTAEIEGNTITIPKIEISVQAQKPVVDQVKMFFQSTLGASADVNAVALPKDSKYFVIVSAKNLGAIKQAIPPEWNFDGKEYYVLRSNRPVVDLFVMSYCPFGLQAEKAIIPVVKLLGNKIDFHVRFVNYSMHGKKELLENSRQYCIQKLDYNAYINYLSCFTKEGNAEKCMKEAGINTADINACMGNLDKEYNIMATYNNRASWGGMFPPYPVEDQMNKDYSVRGSPTLVVQYVPMGGTPRNPEALKEIICSAFLNPPKECSTQLSSENTSPGIGSSATGGAAGSCG